MSIDQERSGRIVETDDEGVQADPKKKMAISAQEQNFDIVLFINEMQKRVNLFSKAHRPSISERTDFAFLPKLKSLTFLNHLQYKMIMKFKSIFPIGIVLLCFCIIVSSALADDAFYDPQLKPYDGQAYTGAQDPQYISYDSILREYMAKRIHERFGITLDPKTYSGFDLLEIEALLKCKKAEEPADTILKMFPKYR
jgi:hypothetical protein